MIGNRGDLPRGLDRGDPPRHPVGDGRRRPSVRSRRTSGSSTTTPTDWSQARDLAAEHPERLRELQEVFDREAEKHHVLPARRPGHRAREPRRRRPARPAPRPVDAVLRPAGRPAHRGGRAQRQEPLARDHRRPRGGHRHQRRGGRAGRTVRRLVALPRRRRARTTPTTSWAATSPSCAAAKPMTPGRHDLVVRFDYDGGPPGSGADGDARGRRRRRSARAGSRPRRPTTSPSTRPSTSASTAARRWSTTTCRCATGSRASSTGCGSTSDDVADPGTDEERDARASWSTSERLLLAVARTGAIAVAPRRRPSRGAVPAPSPADGSSHLAGRHRPCVGSDDPDHPEEWPVREVELGAVPDRAPARSPTPSSRSSSPPPATAPTPSAFGWSFVFGGFLPDDFPPTRGVAAAPWWREVHGATGRTPRARTPTWPTAPTTRSCTCPAATPRRTPRGGAPGCRPRPSGSTPRAAAWWASRSRGATSSSPAASTG